MHFCPKCKSLLMPKNGILICSCGYKIKGSIELKETIKQPKDIIIVDENVVFGDAPVPIVCWNCKKRGVYVKVHFFRSDEAPLRMYKCKHCKKVWRSSK